MFSVKERNELKRMSSAIFGSSSHWQKIHKTLNVEYAKQRVKINNPDGIVKYPKVNKNGSISMVNHSTAKEAGILEKDATPATEYDKPKFRKANFTETMLYLDKIVEARILTRIKISGTADELLSTYAAFFSSGDCPYSFGLTGALDPSEGDKYEKKYGKVIASLPEGVGEALQEHRDVTTSGVSFDAIDFAKELKECYANPEKYTEKFRKIWNEHEIAIFPGLYTPEVESGGDTADQKEA